MFNTYLPYCQMYRWITLMVSRACDLGLNHQDLDIGDIRACRTCDQ